MGIATQFDTIERDVERVAEHVFSTLGAMLMFVQLVFIVFVYAWGLALLVGMALCVFRLVFLASLPVLIVLADPIVAIITAVCDALFLAQTATLFFVNGVIIDSLDDIPGVDIPEVSPIFKGFLHLSVAEYKAALRGINRNCYQISDVSDMLYVELPQASSPVLCPQLRALYPVGLGEPLRNSFATFVADGNPDLAAQGNNCQEGVHAFDMDWAGVCTGLAAGSMVVEIIVPLILFGVFILAGGSALFSLLLYILELAWHLLYFTALHVHALVHDMDRAAEFICSK